MRDHRPGGSRRPRVRGGRGRRRAARPRKYANEIAFACDFVVARDDTRFALPEIGIGAVGALMMARFMSSGKALELGLGGEWMSAEEARTFGLVNQILPGEDFDAALSGYAEGVAAFLQKPKPGWRHR